MSNPGKCSCAFAVFDDDFKLVHQSARVLEGLHTNNYAEYTALYDLLLWASAKEVNGLLIHCDSKLVVEQMSQRWVCNKSDLKTLLSSCYFYLVKGRHGLIHIRGHAGIAGNELVDRLCNEVLDEANA